MDEQLTRDDARTPRSLSVAIVSLAAVAFTTTAGGVMSLESGPSHTWPVIVIATLLSTGLSVGIAFLAHRIYARPTFIAVVALVVIGTIAAGFDAAWFSRLFAPSLAATTKPAVDDAQRSSESRRLVGESAAAIGTLRQHLEERRTAGVRAASAARERAAYEERIGTDRRRGCGPICSAALQQAADQNASADGYAELIRKLDALPLHPASDSWAELTAFHATILSAIRSSPVGADVVPPSAPVEVSALTANGNDRDVGGLGAIIELVGERRFSDPRFAVPAFFAAVCEYAVLFLVLGTRPWRPFSAWWCDVLERIEGTIERMPALMPLVGRVLVRGVLHESYAEKTARRARHARSSAWDASFRETLRLRNLERAVADWNARFENTATSVSPNGHDIRSERSPQQYGDNANGTNPTPHEGG